MTARAPIGFVLETMLLNMNEGNAVCDPRALRHAIETFDAAVAALEFARAELWDAHHPHMSEAQFIAEFGSIDAAIALAKGPQS